MAPKSKDPPVLEVVDVGSIETALGTKSAMLVTIDVPLIISRESKDKALVVGMLKLEI